ncbi:MAG: nuclear transport factor 2 family protein [Solirubrobacteraceae bacterium]
MSFFADDCVLEMPRGLDPWGRRLEGRDQVREGLASRFAGIPDVHYGRDRHWIAGDRGCCSEWLLTGRRATGSQSLCAAATCSSSRTIRSAAKTPTGRSSSPTLSRARARPLGLKQPTRVRDHGTCIRTALTPQRASNPAVGSAIPIPCRD